MFFFEAGTWGRDNYDGRTARGWRTRPPFSPPARCSPALIFPPASPPTKKKHLLRRLSKYSKFAHKCYMCMLFSRWGERL